MITIYLFIFIFRIFIPFIFFIVLSIPDLFTGGEIVDVPPPTEDTSSFSSSQDDYPSSIDSYETNDSRSWDTFSRDDYVRETEIYRDGNDPEKEKKLRDLFKTLLRKIF